MQAKNLPKWFWPVGIAAALALGLYLRSRSNSSSAAPVASQAPSSVTSPPATYTSGGAYADGSVDPTTGIPYAAEMYGGYSSPYGSGVDPTTGVPYSTEITNLQTAIANMTPANLDTTGATSPSTTAPLPSNGGGTTPINISLNLGQAAGNQSGAPNVSGKTGTISTHAGGRFFNWFKKAYGVAPPKTLKVTDPRYVAWTKGQKPPKVK